MSLAINSQATTPLIDQIVIGLKQQIDERVLRPGSRLPSIRHFADEHRVSRFTVVQAYDRLVAAGYIQSRKGSGFYVSKPLEATPAKGKNPRACRLECAVDELWMLRQGFQHLPDYQALPGCGWLPPTWLENTGIQKALRHTARLPIGQLVNYGEAAGYLPLRQDLQKRLDTIGVNAGLEQIITTHGVSHALDLVRRYLVSPGETVLVDDPGYFSLFGYLKLQGIKIIGIPRRLDGPDTEAMEKAIQAHRPKLYFANTLLHNPTGTDIKQSVAYRVLQLAEKYDLMIVEDDVYGDLHAAPVTRLATLDQLNRVIYVNSFSKTLSSAMRVGYIACHRDLAQSLLDVKLLTQLSTSEVNERVIHQILAEGYYRKHLEHLRARLQAAREHTIVQLEACGLSLFHEPQQGLFLWARLPECAYNAPTLASLAADEGIMLAPGNIFRPYQESSPWLRFNAAFCDKPITFEFLRRML